MKQIYLVKFSGKSSSSSDGCYYSEILKAFKNEKKAVRYLEKKVEGYCKENFAIVGHYSQSPQHLTECTPTERSPGNCSRRVYYEVISYDCDYSN
jgi:hypothetical protein